jgi:hypothetical protein
MGKASGQSVEKDEEGRKKIKNTRTKSTRACAHTTACLEVHRSHQGL